MSYPWYVRLLLIDPERVLEHLARMQRAGIVDATPNAWQLSLGVLRMWHRLMYRPETVGTSQKPVRATWRARLLENRALRLPFLLANGAVVPFDFTGLRSRPERLITHLLGAHHDGNQFVFDLELLAGHGRLDELAARVAAILDGSDPRATWLRDLTVHVGYHEALADAVSLARADGPQVSPQEAIDPDLSLRGLVAWCARQPATLEDTLAAWRLGRFHLGTRPPRSAPTNEALLSASTRDLADWFDAGHPITPEQLAGAEYRGTSLGIPSWVERLTWKRFVKVFVDDDAGLRGWNVRVEQQAPWAPRRRGDAPHTFGHFAVVHEAGSTLLDYGRGGNRRGDPVATLRDPLVALEPGSADRLLGRSLVDVAGHRLPTPSYFLLERMGPVHHVAHPPRARP